MSKFEAFAWWVITVLFVSVLVIAAAQGHTLPNHWLNKFPYVDPVTKETCCYHRHEMASLNHCHELDYTPIRHKDGSYTLQTGETVPAARVQWSKDYQYYECRAPDGHLLCFFAKPDGS